MTNYKKAGASDPTPDPDNPIARRLFIGLLGVKLLFPFSASGKGGNTEQKQIELSVVLWTYLDRTITEIDLNGTDLGVAGAYGGTGIITDVSIPFGEQKLTWKLGGPEGMARNGAHCKNKNKIMINASDVPPGTRYLGIHVYPDHTAEITFSAAYPRVSERGGKIRQGRK
jgi:hypothetical protein